MNPVWVKDDPEPVAGHMEVASPRFMWGWRRFTATVIRESLASARFLAAFTHRHPKPGQSFAPKLAGRVANCCAAWLWIFGRGNKGFTFNECCEINGLETCCVLQSVVNILAGAEDIKRVDQWVQEHCRITGCLLPDWGEDA